MRRVEELPNRVIAWNRDGITIEADQRLGASETTPRHHVPWRGRMRARGSTNEDRDRSKLITWHDVNNGDDRDQPQMADDDDNDSQALTGGNITRYRALAARISCLSQDRQDLKFASMQVCCAMGEADHARHGTRQEDRTMPRREAESEALFPLAAEWRVGSVFGR